MNRRYFYAGNGTKEKERKVLDFIERVESASASVHLIFMVMSDPGADQPGMQHDRNQCCKSDQWRNGSGEEPHQQRWPCLAVRKSAF